MTEKLPWFRVYPEMLNDRKLDAAAQLAGVSNIEMVGAWVAILCLAAESPVRGSLYVTSRKCHSDVTVTAALRISDAQCTAILKALVEFDMLEIVDGAYAVTNWHKRQYENDRSASRTREYRARKAEKQGSDVTVTSQGRHSDVSVTPPEDRGRGQNTDTEAEVNLAPDDVGILSPLSAAFVAATNIPELTGGVVEWTTALDDMQKAGVEPQDIFTAVEEMRGKKYSIVRLRSVVNPAIAAMGKRKSGKNGNGGASGHYAPPGVRTRTLYGPDGSTIEVPE